MPQKHEDEGHRRHGSVNGLVSLRIRVSERDVLAVVSFNTVVADKHALRVRTDVFETGHAVADVFTIADPGFQPGVRRNAVEKPQSLQPRFEFSFEQFHEGFRVDKKLGIPREHPIFSILGETATRNEEVDMRMELAIAPPSLQGSNHADLGAKEALVPRQFFDRRAGGGEERAVHFAGEAQADVAQLGWQGQCDHVMIHRQYLVLSFGQPFRYFVVATFGTVAITAGLPGEFPVSTPRTRIERAALHFGSAAGADIVNGASLLFGQRRPWQATTPIAEDGGKFGH